MVGELNLIIEKSQSTGGFRKDRQVPSEVIRIILRSVDLAEVKSLRQSVSDGASNLTKLVSWCVDCYADA